MSNMNSAQAFMAGDSTADYINLSVPSTRMTKLGSSSSYIGEETVAGIRGPHKFGAISDGMPNPSKTDKKVKDKIPITPRAALQDMDSNSKVIRTPLATGKSFQLNHGQHLFNPNTKSWQNPFTSRTADDGLEGEQKLVSHGFIETQKPNQAITRSVVVDKNVDFHAHSIVDSDAYADSYLLHSKNPTQPWVYENVDQDHHLRTTRAPWLPNTEERVQGPDRIHEYRNPNPVQTGNGSTPLEDISRLFPHHVNGNTDVLSSTVPSLRDTTFAQNHIPSTSGSGGRQLVDHNPSLGTSSYYGKSTVQNPLNANYDDTIDLIARINGMSIQDRDAVSTLISDYMDSALHSSNGHHPVRPCVGDTKNYGTGLELLSDGVDSFARRSHELDQLAIFCSPNYKGNPLLSGNQSANIPQKDSCSLWITNLNLPVADRAYRDLLHAIKGCGKVYACVINPPDSNMGHTTCAAKLVFFDKSGAQALLRRSAAGEFVINGYVPKVVYNRIRTASQPPGPESRVIHIDGPKQIVDKNVLMQFFGQRFNFQTEDIVVLREDPGPHGRRRLEWRFGSYRCQAATAISTIQKLRGILPPGVIGNFWGQVIVFYGVDPCVEQQ